jgi:hypothetical protein
MSRLAMLAVLLLTACSSIPSSSEVRYVTYRVTSEAAALVSLTYINAEGISEQRMDRRLSRDWSISFTAPPNRFLYLAVQNGSDEGSIACEILVDGVPLKQSSSEGKGGLAICDGRTRQ